MQAFCVHDVIALLVNHLALVIGDVVVLQQLLAYIKVAGLDLALCRLNAARNDTRFNGLTVRHFQTLHDGLDAVTREDSHQRIIQTQVKPR